MYEEVILTKCSSQTDVTSKRMLSSLTSSCCLKNEPVPVQTIKDVIIQQHEHYEGGGRHHDGSSWQMWGPRNRMQCSKLAWIGALTKLRLHQNKTTMRRKEREFASNRWHHETARRRYWRHQTQRRHTRVAQPITGRLWRHTPIHATPTCTT